MDLILILKAAILGVVEGLTEFLPISSTGHLILVGDLLDFNSEQGKVFQIVIQCGAILAVAWEFRSKLAGVAMSLAHREESRAFVWNLLIAFLPLAILGLAFGGAIKAMLFRPVPVALAFIAGGVLILWAEKRHHVVRVQTLEQMQWKDALLVGLAQTLALIPGMSRAGSTIIGGLLFGLSRRAATEFSFFLAIPVLFSASGYELFKHRAQMSADDLGILAVGTITSFVSAFFCVRWLLRYVSRHDFTIFAWYRIAFGIVVLLTAYTGTVNWTIA
ncbi:MAG: undecaprenyl-diphosphate phosphatase [Burkholderiales bacterium]